MEMTAEEKLLYPSYAYWTWPFGGLYFAPDQHRELWAHLPLTICYGSTDEDKAFACVLADCLARCQPTYTTQLVEFGTVERLMRPVLYVHDGLIEFRYVGGSKYPLRTGSSLLSCMEHCVRYWMVDMMEAWMKGGSCLFGFKADLLIKFDHFVRVDEPQPPAGCVWGIQE